MVDSRDKPEFETLGYKPKCDTCKDTGKAEVICRPLDEEIPQYIPCQDCEKGKALVQPDWKKQVRDPANASRETLGFNSHVIKPETRVNKVKDADQLLNDYKPPKCALPDENGGVLANPEQPNQNLMIIEEIEGLFSQVNEKIHKLTFSHNTSDIAKKQTLWSQAIEEIDLFQKTKLFDLRKAFE